MRLFLSEASVHLSRQFLEKLTDSAIIKIALWEDLSGEVATGSRWLAASPAVVEGCPRWRGTGRCYGAGDEEKWQLRRCI
jgi:hypothetical protein